MRMEKVKHFDFLKKIGFSPTNLGDFSLKVYEKGEYVFLQGDEIRNIAVIYSGKVHIEISAKTGKTLLLAIYSSSALLGDIEFFTDTLATSCAKAVTSVSLLSVRFDRLRDENTQILSILGHSLAHKLARSVQNNAMNILNEADARIASYICLTAENGCFQANLTKLAEILGISYRHLSRTLQKLCSQEVLEKDRQVFFIKDPEKLQALAQDHYSSSDILLRK